MKEILDFLNTQNGDRLFWYGVVLIIIVALVVKGLVSIFESIASIFKNRHKKETKKVNKNET